MGSPISLERPWEEEGKKELSLETYVLGETPPVPVNRLDMAEVLEGVIERMKPQLKYLPYFKPLAELLNGGFVTGCATRRTDIALVEFPDGMSERTKAIEIEVLEEADAETTSVRKSLLLTENGDVLVWSAVYDRPVTVQFTRGRDEVARESRFEIFDKQKLTHASMQPHLWKVNWKEVLLKILTSLLSAMEKCIEDREKYLRNIKDAHSQLYGTLHRIWRPL